MWTSGDIFEVNLSGKTLKAAQEHLIIGTAHPAALKYAATVMLVRNVPSASPKELKECDTKFREGNLLSRPNHLPKGREPVEVFMLRRASSMAFAPDAVVFPGGSVDSRDSDIRLPWVGPAPSEWATRMGCDEKTARGIVIAAMREVFEECGVLLAGSSESNVIDDLTDEVWDIERELLSSHKESFAEMLMRRNLVLRSDLLGLRSHWITPVFEPRRYNTFFFSALLPEGQIPDDRTSEATFADWAAPSVLFDKAEAGDIVLLPPTRYNLSFLRKATSAETFVAEKPSIEEIMLEAYQKEKGEVVLRCILP